MRKAGERELRERANAICNVIKSERKKERERKEKKETERQRNRNRTGNP